MTKVTLIEKTTRYSETPAWAVEYVSSKGKLMRTDWTAFREEACVWGRIIRDHGHCASANAGPV